MERRGGGAGDRNGGSGGADMMSERGGESSSSSSSSGIEIHEQLEMQGIALAGVLKVCEQVAALAGQIREVLGGGGGRSLATAVMSPLVASCLYEAPFNHMWYYRESGRPDLVAPIREITGALKLMAAVWKVGGKFRPFDYSPIAVPFLSPFLLPSLLRP